MKIIGMEGLTDEQIDAELRNGAKFVIFSYVISVLIMTYKRPTDVYFIRAGESAVGKALPFIAISLALGWWGFPFGLIYTPWSIVENLGGGKDVTSQLLASIGKTAPARAPMQAAAGGSAPLTPR